ncbi:MAG: hypothetical protein ABJG68_01910 [Crocinitomicaceae bacterium]
MKLIKLFIVLSVLFVAQPLLAQNDTPEKVHSIVYVRKDFDWYTKQYELWKKELSKNKKDPASWMNLLTAARMAKLTSPDSDTRKLWKNNELNSFDGFEKQIKGSYEYWILKRWKAFIDWDDVDNPDELKERRMKIQEYCLNAYKMDPNRPDVYGNLLNFFMEEGNEEKSREIAEKWMASGDITYSLYAMNYNTLVSCHENAILFTQGDNDSYPSWVLQYAKNVRTDVTVINIWLAHSNREYRNTIFKAAKIPAMANNPESKDMIIDHVLENLGERELCFAPNFAISNYDSLAEKVYNVGAALVYSENDFNNSSLLVYNFENKYLLDHLTSDIQYEEWPEKAKEANFNYISGLFTLLQHYYLTQQHPKLKYTKEMIMKIVEGTKYGEEILGHLDFYTL